MEKKKIITDEEIVSANPKFKEGQDLSEALDKWTQVRDAVEKKYPERSDMERAQLIGQIMKRLKLTDVTKGMR